MLSVDLCLRGVYGMQPMSLSVRHPVTRSAEIPLISVLLVPFYCFMAAFVL